jgi:1-acyl-sn-glycerol-3-phosphate acyltransferase
VKNSARALWRLARALWQVPCGLATVWWRLPALDRSGRLVCVSDWARGVLRALNVELDVAGAPQPGAKLLVANHVSWLDIAAIHAVCPEARFVSKADVGHWPLVSSLADAVDTLYIVRERRRDSLRVAHHMAEALRAGDTVALFPEGTTGEGHVPLPFHANLLEAAIATATPVQPLALRYSDAHHAVSPAAMYVGDTTLLQSLWRVAVADGLRVRLQWLPPQASAGKDRRAFAERLRGAIDQALNGGLG